MQVTVDIMDLLLALLILVGVALGIFLIVLVAHLIRTLKNLAELTSDLHDPLTQSAGQLPDLIRKVDGITKDMSVVAKSANENIPEILTDARTITGTARAGVEAVGSAAESVTSGISSLFHPASEHTDNVSSIIGIVSQVIQIVSLFTNRDQTKRRKPFAGFGRHKKRRH